MERADALGLAQLYQIRGRVGRSDVTAHAYLFYPDASELTPEARARLATLADHTELGAGFQIAMRDLEIRGAGDLLGAEQSGHVAALGFELYVEMLNEAVAELSGQARVAVGRSGSTLGSTPTSRRRTSQPRRSRSTCTAGSRSSSTTTSSASSGPRPRTATGRCPSRSRTSSRSRRRSCARAHRRRLPRLPRRSRHRRPPGARRSELRALRRDRGDASTRRRSGRWRSDRGARGGARACRCYRCRAPGRLSTWQSDRAEPRTLSRHARNPPVTARRLQEVSMKRSLTFAAAALAAVSLVAAGCGDSDEVPTDAVAVVDGTRREAGDSTSSWLARRSPTPRRSEPFPKAGTGRVPVAADAGGRVPRPTRGVHTGGRAARPEGHDARQKEVDDRIRQDAVVRRQPEEVGRRSSRRRGTRCGSLREDTRHSSCPRGFYKEVTERREGLRRRGAAVLQENKTQLQVDRVAMVRQSS